MAHKDRPDRMTIQIAVIDEKITNMQGALAEIKDQLGEHYITIDQFTPVRNLVYGLVGLILTSVVGALVALVVRTGV